MGAGVLFGFWNEERGNVAFACATRRDCMAPALIFGFLEKKEIAFI